MTQQPIDPLQIFLHASRFQISEEHLRRTDDPQMMAFIGAPSIVLSAFASELFFKCIHVLETGNAPMGHNLYKLFKGIKSSTRKRMAMHWDVAVLNHEPAFKMNEAMSGKLIARDLPGALQNCARAFEGMRYIYEDPMKTNFYLIDLPGILKTVIIEIKPEWRDVGPAPAKEMTPASAD